MTFRSNRLLGPETRPCVQSESHSYLLECMTDCINGNYFPCEKVPYDAICRNNFGMRLDLSSTTNLPDRSIPNAGEISAVACLMETFLTI